jgi:LysR family nitrogen assimilation transcriptional regulator
MTRNENSRPAQRPAREAEPWSLLDARWRIFLQIAQAGSLTRAALESGSAQSLLSRQLAALEAECGARLFRRTGRGVVLSEFGERVLPRVQAMLDEARRLGDEVQQARGQPLGDVHVGLLPAAVPWLAERLYRAVRTDFPQVRLHMTEGTSTQLSEMVLAGRLDMALLLREGPDTPPGADSGGDITLRRMALHLIGAEGDALVRRATLPFARLDGLPLVLPPHPHALRAHLAEIAAQRGVRLRVAVEANSIALQREIAAAGDCYAIVASLAVVSHMQAHRLGATRLVAPVLWRRVVLTSTPLRPDTLATREVRALVVRLSRLHMPEEEK